MLCPECRRENPDSARYCSECGHKIYLCLSPGTLLHEDRYEIKTLIKQGAMGAIYEVWDYEGNKSAALKVMIPSHSDEDDREKAEERFENEAKLLSQLSHKGLPRVIDYFPEEGACCLVMDLIEGEDFEEIIERDGKPGLPEDVVRKTSIEILNILEYLHSQDPPILYRDVKPSNIMRRDSDGKIFLVDFGIAKVTQKQPVKTGTKLGTEGYAPVEQYRGKAEPRSDLYSLGATMHHMLTGRPPEAFNFDCLKKITPAVSSTMVAIVSRALEVDPKDRFQSAVQMREALMGNIKLINIMDKRTTHRGAVTKPAAITPPPSSSTVQEAGEEKPNIKNVITTAKPAKVTVPKDEEKKKDSNDFGLVMFLMTPVLAIALLIGALFLGPGLFYSYHLNKGTEAFNAGKYKDAVKSLESAVKYDPGKAAPYLIMGKVFLAENNYDESIKNLRLAVKKDKTLKNEVSGDLAAACYKKAEVLSENGRYEDAAYFFKEAFKLNPVIQEGKDHLTLYYRGLMKQQEGASDEAVELFTASLKKKKIAMTAFSRAEVYLAQGDFLRAKTDLDLAVSLDPGMSKKAGDLRGQILERVRNEARSKLGSQKFNETIKYISDMKDLLGKDPELRKIEAEAYLGNGINYHSFYEYDKALTFVNKALELNPDLAGAYFLRGEIYSSQEKFDEALINYKRAQEMDPGAFGAKSAMKIQYINRRKESLERIKIYKQRYSVVTPGPVKYSKTGMKEYRVMGGSSSSGYVIRYGSGDYYLIKSTGRYCNLNSFNDVWGKLSENSMQLYIPDSRGNEEIFDFKADRLQKITVTLISKSTGTKKGTYITYSGGSHTITLRTEAGSTFFISGFSSPDELRQGSTYPGIVYPSRVELYTGENYIRRSYNITGSAEIKH